MYDKHINIGRTYTQDRNRRVAEAVKKWAACHQEHYYRMGTLGAAKTRELGLNGIPTKLEQIMENALKEYNIVYIPQYKYTIGFMDFYIPEPNIDIFVDGTYWHADPRIFEPEDVLFFGKAAEWVWKKDMRQTNYLKSQGYMVLRFWEREITENLDVCIQNILQAIKEKKYKPNSANPCKGGDMDGSI
jgi:DNA mismatch endonuclease, patch repair protein